MLELRGAGLLAEAGSEKAGDDGFCGGGGAASLGVGGEAIEDQEVAQGRLR
jgi:hypothetical protein